MAARLLAADLLTWSRLHYPKHRFRTSLEITNKGQHLPEIVVACSNRGDYRLLILVHHLAVENPLGRDRPTERENRVEVLAVIDGEGA